MQLKTINKTIRTKVTDWISSITDNNLRNKLESHIIVTGGCITSLFLNEDVNDYDIYISDINTLNLLCYYYIKEFTNIEILDGRNKDLIIKQFNEEYKDIYFKDINPIEIHRSYRATCIRNLKENQIKLYFPDEKESFKVDYDTRVCMKSFQNFIGNEYKFNKDSKYHPLFFSANAITLSDDIQIIIRFNGDPEEIHKNYDFVHATNYWTFSKGLVTNKEALESILTRQLKYQGSLYPITSILRVKKFVTRKWKINAGEIFKMIYQTSLLDLTNEDVLEEQLIGMDVAYFSVLIRALREVSDRTKLTSEYIFNVVDRIFENEQSEEEQ